MAANQNFIVYNEEVKLEEYGPTCIKAGELYREIRNDIQDMITYTLKELIQSKKFFKLKLILKRRKIDL